MVKKTSETQAKTAQGKATGELAVENKKEVKVTESAVEKKTPVKKPAAKKTVKSTAKKAAPTKTTAKAAAVKTVSTEKEMILQFGGREIREQELFARIKEIWMQESGKKEQDLKSLKVYVKPEEFTAYYVINDDITGSIDL